MSNSQEPDIRQVWQQQKTEEIRMSIEEIRRRAGKLNRRVWQRNAREYVASLIVALFFGYDFWRSDDTLERAGYGLIVAGTLWVAWQLHRRGRAMAMPEDMGAAGSVEFLRNELMRQRDALRAVWRWYLGPLIPGLAVLIAAFARTNPAHLRHYGWIVTAYTALAAAFFWWVGRLNLRAADRLDRQIRELER